MKTKMTPTYTVKQLAELSKVSPRTLRFYDEIGLLVPAHYGENGYRYYQKEQLLQLQQILFYRELGFELSVIQKILQEPGFDHLSALKAHQQKLQDQQKHLGGLLQTLNKTIQAFQGGPAVLDQDLYMGFDLEKQNQYEEEIIQKYGDQGQAHLLDSKNRTIGWKKEDYLQIQQDYEELHQAFTSVLMQGLAFDHPQVQKLVQRHYQIVSRFWTPNRQAYIGLGQSYLEHPDFIKLYQVYHPQLGNYLAEAMKVYAEDHLSM